MLQTNLLNPGHSDLVTHVVYDFYGERLATCSADQKIKVFHKNSEDTWEPEAEWKAHDAPLLRLAFAHPLHGSLIASCSHDRTVRVWEEPSASTSTSNAANRDGRWVEKGILTGSKGSVRDVEFAPPSPAFGLRVGSVSTDSHLRIHSSLDPNLNDWSLSNSIYVPSLVLAGSSDASNPEAVTVSPTTTDELATGGWGLSWCKERWWGSVLAVFAGTSPVVKIITLNPSPTSLVHLTPKSTSPLTSMSWAPSCGRSYHLIATGARDGAVRIWKVEIPSDGEDSEQTSKDRWKAETVADLEHGSARVGMVDWNATGTTLTTSDDEGVIRIYKSTFAKSWRLFGKMTAEEPEEANGH